MLKKVTFAKKITIKIQEDSNENYEIWWNQCGKA